MILTHVIDLSLDAVALTEALVNIESVSRNEQAIADAIEEALRGARPPRGAPARQHASSPAPTSAATSAW